MSYDQDPNTPTRYFVGLYADLASAPAQTTGGVNLTDPATEPEGVESRRFVFAHRFNAADVTWLNEQGEPHGMAVLDELPEDWRS